MSLHRLSVFNVRVALLVSMFQYTKNRIRLSVDLGPAQLQQTILCSKLREECEGQRKLLVTNMGPTNCSVWLAFIRWWLKRGQYEGSGHSQTLCSLCYLQWKLNFTHFYYLCFRYWKVF